jgi:serine/threonine protein phosphatase PrpC
MKWNWQAKRKQAPPHIPLDACRTAFRLEGYTEGYKVELEDRLQIVRLKDRLVLAVADGAGGRPGGARAAEMVMEFVRQAAAETHSADVADFWYDVLMECDGALLKDAKAGETTAVVAAISEHGVVGASVGDSGAWIVTAEDVEDLTMRQERKPFLGTGAAYPITFASHWESGTLLIASDGLFKYADADMICQAAREADIETAADRLLNLVRLRSGKLQDDVAILLCRAF